MLKVLAFVFCESLLDDGPWEGVPVLLAAQWAALALGKPLKQAGFMVHVHWVAIELNDILLV